jgi:hypothetical protein
MTDTSLLGGDGSSVDELALSNYQTQRSPSRARSKTPLSYKLPSMHKQILSFDAAPTLRGTSPSKSMILETPAKPGSSPWRIKVTVEAEPNSDELPGQAFIVNTPSKPSVLRSRKMTVPLNDADPSPAKRGRGRPRKSDAATPATSAIKKRKGTPMRRRSIRLSGDKKDITEDENAAKPTPKRRGRPPKGTKGETLPEASRPLDVQADVQPLPLSSQPEPHSLIETESAPPENEVQLEAEQYPPLSSALEHHSFVSEPASPMITAGVQEQSSPSPLRQEQHPSAASETLTAATGVQTTHPVVTSSAGLPDSTRLTPLQPNDSMAAKPNPASSPPGRGNFIYRRTPQVRLFGREPQSSSREVTASPERYEFARNTLDAERYQLPRRLQEWSQEGVPHSSSSVPKSSAEVHDHVVDYDKIDESDDNNYLVNESAGPAEEDEINKGIARSPMIHEMEINANQDAEMWRHMIPERLGDSSPRDGLAAHSDSDDSDFGDGMEFTGHPIGENTMMQSEEFSMVSLDSLRELQSSFIEGEQADVSRVQDDQPNKRSSKLSQTYFPNPASRGAQASPRSPREIAENTSRPSSSAVQRHRSGGSNSRLHRVPSPEIARIAKASNTLQDALSSPKQRNFVRRPIHSGYSHSASGGSFVAMASPNSGANDGLVTLEQASTPRLERDRALSPLTSLTPGDIRLPTPSSTEKDMQETEPPPPPRHDDGIIYPSLRTPSHNVLVISPAKSEGDISTQTQTPPSTDRGTPLLSDGEVEDKAIDQHSDIRRETPTSMKVLERELEWQRAREEVSRTIQAAKADHVVVIESDEEEDEDGEEDPSDIWQEEASRSSNVHQSSGVDDSHRPDTQRSGKIIFQAEGPKEHRLLLGASNTSAGGSVKGDDAHSHNPPRAEGRPPGTTNSAEISALFRSVAVHKEQRTSEFEEDGAERGGSNDSGLFWQRTLPSLLDQSQEVAGETGDRDRVPTSQRATSRATLRGRLPRDIAHQKSPALAGFRPSIAKNSPARSSPLKRRLSLSKSRSPSLDFSQSNIIDNNTSFMGTNASITSDVRQLRNELKFSRARASLEKTNRAAIRVPTKIVSVDDTVEDQRDATAKSSLLSITPKRTYKSLFPRNQPQQEEEHPRPSKSRKITESSTTSTGVAALATSTAEVISWVWSSLPFSYRAPPQPTHPLLVNLPLLPRIEPWTRTHYRVMDQLYQLYKKQSNLFSTSHPDNTGLMTPSLVPFIDIEIFNWGYRVRLNANLIILASLFMRLLVLHDIPEYERIKGEQIDVGECSTHASGEEITQWRVLVKLFSVEAGEMLRDDEERRKPIDRRPDMKRWRFKGEKEWIWRKDLTREDESGLHLSLKDRKGMF